MSRFILESLDSIYNFDNTIFDNFNLPEGLSKNVICDNILFEAAELSVLYGDPEYLKKQIGIWSAGRLYSWQLIYDSINLEHDPLTTFKYTYKKIIDMDESKQHVGDRNGSETGGDVRTVSTVETTDFDKTVDETVVTDQDSTGNRMDSRDIATDETNTLSKAAYDNPTLATAEQTVKDLDTSDDLASSTMGTLDETKDTDSTITEDTTRNRVDTDAYSRTLSDSDHETAADATDRDTIEEYETSGYKDRTPSELIFEELKLADINLVDIITNEFINKFCIGVY